MTLFPETQDSLLMQVQDPQNAEAWEQFSQLYRPVIYRLARRRGLQDADAQDLSQQVLVSVSAAIVDWEKRGSEIRFRHWLRKVTRNAIVNALTRKPQDAATGGTSILEFIHSEPHPNDEITQQLDLEYRRELYLRAAEIIRHDVLPETWQAFRLSVVEGLGIDETAREIGKSVGTVYAARSRIMRRLQEAVAKLDREDEIDTQGQLWNGIRSDVPATKASGQEKR